MLLFGSCFHCDAFLRLSHGAKPTEIHLGNLVLLKILLTKNVAIDKILTMDILRSRICRSLLMCALQTGLEGVLPLLKKGQLPVEMDASLINQSLVCCVVGVLA